MTKAKKKAKSETKGTAKKKSSPKKAAVKLKKDADFVKVRKNIAALVGGSASKIAAEVIKVARQGQLAQAKYLFEAVGLYPPTEETMARPQDSLSYMVLKSLGLPTEPVGENEEAVGNLAGRDKAPVGKIELDETLRRSADYAEKSEGEQTEEKD